MKDVLVNQCCHPHNILAQHASPQEKLQFIFSIYASILGTTKENGDLTLILNGVFQIFKDGAVLPQCMPEGAPEYDGWLAKHGEVVHSAWEIVKGTVFGPLTVAQFRYIDGNLKGLGLCHELVRSAWDIVNVRVEGVLTDAQQRHIKGVSKGLQKWQKASTRRAEVALLIREKRADEATEEEREENKKGVASGKKGACEYHCNTWAIKSKVQEEVLEFGKQKACELTGLSTTDVANFLIASEVNTSFATVMRSMKLKIEEKKSASYSELLLGIGKKKKQSGILVMQLSSVNHGKAVKVE